MATMLFYFFLLFFDVSSVNGDRLNDKKDLSNDTLAYDDILFSQKCCRIISNDNLHVAKVKKDISLNTLAPDDDAQAS